MNAEQIQQMLQDSLPNAEIKVEGEDGVHFEAMIIAPEFEGLNPIKRHRLVYDALGNAMESAIHALSIKAYTPDEIK